MKKKKVPFIIAIPICLLIAFIIVFFIIRVSFQNLTEKQELSHLNDMIDLQNQSLGKTANEWMNYTKSLASMIGSNGIFDQTEISNYTKSLNETLDGESLLIVDANGDGYDVDGSFYNIYDRDYFQNAMNGKTCISSMLTSKKTMDSIICVASPISYNGEILGVIVYIISSDTLSSIFENDVLNSLGSTAVMQEDGAVIFQLGDTLVFGDNLTAANGIAPDLDSENMNQLEQDIQNKDDGYVKFDSTESADALWGNSPSDSDNYFITHTYNEETGWTIVTMVDPVSFENYSADLSLHVTTLSYICFGIIILFLIFTMIAILLFVKQNAKKQQIMQSERERFELVSQYMNTSIFEYNIFEKLLFCSKKAEESFKDKIQESIKLLLSQVTSEHPDLNTEFSVTDEEGNPHWYQLQMSTIFIDHHPGRIIGQISDIDEEKLETDQLKKKAELDQMTGLYNKITFIHTAEYELSHHSDQNYALFFIDIDNFKQVNDTLGHKAGDDLLIHISSIIRSQFRDSDLIGRFGGDEFVVFLHNTPSINTLSSIASRLCKTVESDTSKDLPKGVSISVGISCYPSAATSFAELMDYSDDALYVAKSKGKNQFFLYEKNK